MTESGQARSAAGAWFTHPGDAGTRRLHRRIVSVITAAVAEIKGPDAAAIVLAGGLQRLHDAIDPLDLGAVRDYVLERLRDDLLAAAVRVGRSVMGWGGEFYVDDYLILRINLPYEVARNADPAAENPGIGRVSASVRATAAARKVIDPVYDPKAYHRAHPPAAWAHGAHVDSWSGHSKDGLNIWWAISDVPAEAGMVLYPELRGRRLACDPRSLYLERGHELPVPTFVPMAAGEMLIFDPEIMHGTHLNVTPQTRVAVSMRLNAAEPRFDPSCFYAREFWRRATDIEANRLETVVHLKREDHLAPATAPVAIPAPQPVRVVQLTRDGGDTHVEVGPSTLLPDGARLVAALPDQRVLLTRSCGRLYAIDAVCPHYGAELSDGGVGGTTVHCPACAVGFDLETGRSATPSLRVKTFAVVDDDGMIRLDLAG